MSISLEGAGGVRARGRPVNSTGSCAAEFYYSNRQYSRVCGRIIGYQVASPDAFNDNADSRGLDGVIISHGAQQDHIWSFAAGVTERGSQYNNCPFLQRQEIHLQHILKLTTFVNLETQVIGL